MFRDGLKWVGLLAAWFLGVAPAATAQELTDSVVAAAADPLIKNKIADGLSIGYLEGEHYGIVHLGASNRRGTRADNRTVYEIGSLSKVFTGLMLADAVVRGEIDLEAAVDVSNPVNLRLPEYQGRPIRWVDLSTHRSGLPRLPGNLPVTSLRNPYQKYDSNLAAEALAQYELPRAPGQKHEYSNFGASVLGYLVAQNSDATYQRLLRQRIAGPLGMVDCTVELTSDQKARFATPHTNVGSPTAVWTFADLPGAGGVRATMRDMMRFAKAQLHPPTGTLGEAIELAWKPHCDADASGPAMGLGWLIAGDGETRWHNGHTGGSHSALFINRRLDCAIIVLCNTAVTNELEGLATQLMLKVAGVSAQPSTDPNEGAMVAGGDDPEIDAKLRGRLVGRYQLTPQFIFDVQDRQGHLMVGITNQPTQEVFPDSATHWSYRSVDATLEFKLGKKGPAKRLILHQNGIEQTARRIGR